MSRTSRSALFGILITAVALAGCDKVPLLAPTNSTIRLNASVGVVPVNGTLDLTAVVIESAGTPVQNGTVVTFTSSLGTIEPREGRTQNGQVTVRYLSGSQSGKATISAFSGGSKSDDLEILVGGAGAAAVTLRADSTVLPSTGGTTSLVATVLDTGGNPIRGVGVTFSATAGQLTPGTALTNDAGEARTDLFTTRESTVTARVAGGAEAAKADLKIEVRDVPILDLAGGTRSAGESVTWEVGIPLPFKLTPKTGGNPVRSAVLDFGDGTSRTFGQILAATSVNKTYDQTGLYSATATATDVLNFVGSTSIGVTILQKRTIPVQITVQSNSAGLVTFNANVSVPSSLDGLPNITVNTYEWDFGDGRSETTTGTTVSHRYNSATTYTVRVRVISTQGHEGLGQIVVRTSTI